MQGSSVNLGPVSSLTTVRRVLVVQLQGPCNGRSVTATSVHPLALEHTAILRAHFGITGRIARTTVLRDQKTGAAVTSMARLSRQMRAWMWCHNFNLASSLRKLFLR